MKVEAVDVSGRPSDIPISLWIVKGRHYTVLQVLKDMNSVEYYVLEELDLAAGKTLYKGYAASRFRILDGGDTIIEELIKELKLELV